LPPPAQQEVDFSALLESLDVDADEPAQAAAEPPDLVASEMYLRRGDLGYGGELTDELSALTGASRPNRPIISVNQLPELGEEGKLQRDARVDRNTVLKIIDGIENL
jgi:hypothetical protein